MYNVSNIYEYFVHIVFLLQLPYYIVIFSLLQKKPGNRIKNPSVRKRQIYLDREGDLSDGIFLGLSLENEGYVGAVFEYIEHILIEYQIDSSEGQQILKNLNPGLIGKRILLAKIDGKLRVKLKSKRGEG